MDKLENETWEDYAFRNNLFAIKYAYAGKEKTIDDITMPIHTIVNPRYFDVYHYIGYSNNETYKIGFMEFIMYEIYNLRNKYNTGCYGTPIIAKVENMTKEREEDIHRQKWLFDQLAYWENKYFENNREKINVKKLMEVKNRYFELKSTLSERHKKQLDELLEIIRDSSIPLLEGEIKSNMYSEQYWHYREKEKEREKTQNKKERVELYEKYLKNKEIKTQITELEQKLNQLKSQIVQ